MTTCHGVLLVLLNFLNNIRTSREFWTYFKFQHIKVNQLANQNYDKCVQKFRIEIVLSIVRFTRRVDKRVKYGALDFLSHNLYMLQIDLKKCKNFSLDSEQCILLHSQCRKRPVDNVINHNLLPLYQDPVCQLNQSVSSR